MDRADAMIGALSAPPVSARVVRRVIEHVRIPLHRDAYALAVNSGFTAVTGLLYWILAAHTFSASAVGLNSALISAMTFLSGIASLNLPNILVRFLPESGDRIRTRVLSAYAAAATLAAIAGVVFLVGVGAWTPRLAFLGADRGLEGWFVVSTMAWCLFVIQDSVLTALRRAVWVPIENAVFSLLKILLLAATVAMLPRYGIFVSWTIAMLVSVAGVNILIFTRLIRRAPGRRRHAVEVRNRAFARYFAADYACSVAWLSNLYLLPLIVTAVAGAATNAYWALPFAVAFPLYSVSQNIGTSLTLHGTLDRSELPLLVRKAALQGVRVLVPAAIGLVVAAPVLLSLFGPSYVARSTAVLRLLAVGALPNFIIVLAVSRARVRRRLRGVLIALAADAVLALGLTPPLIGAMGVTGIGIGWTGAQCVVAAGLLIHWRRSRGQGRARAAAAAPPPATNNRGTGTVPGSSPHSAEFPDAGEVHPVLRTLFGALELRGLSWSLLRVPSSVAAPTGDVDMLVAAADAGGLRSVARECGFITLPGWESAPDLIFVRYDRPSDRWLLLDVSTSVSFRSPRAWRLPGATGHVLRGRLVNEGIALPADADHFWLLLLHCLLDKRCIPAHYRARLRRLAPAGLSSPLMASLAAAAGDDAAPYELVHAALADDVDTLLALGTRLATALKRRRSVGERGRTQLSRMIRWARKPTLLRRRTGVSVALIGPNGVGKSTAAAALAQSLPFDVRVIYMGMWKHSNRHRSRIGVIMEIVIRPARIWCRYLRAVYHQLRGRMVVFDRYVYDALLPPTPPLVLPKRAYFFLLTRILPRPRATVFLDVDGNVAYERKGESCPDRLDLERRLYGEMIARSFRVDLVDASATADEVRAEITTILWREITARWIRARAAV